MILIDASLLVSARSRSFPRHDAAREWLDEQINRGIRVGLPWDSLLAFVRILSNPKLVQQPEPVDALWSQVEAWLGQELVWIPQPTDRHPEILRQLLPHVTDSNLIPDAHLAALAISHGLTLMSLDGDFARFPELRWENPVRR